MRPKCHLTMVAHERPARWPSTERRPTYAARVAQPVRGVRASMGALVVVAVVSVLVPGVGAYAALRARGASIGLAGVVGLLLMLVATVGYCAWLFGGGRPRRRGRA